MASVNPHTRELVFKLVFYGPGLGGKTTTLQYIFAATKPEHRGKMVSLATPTDRTLYFDFLPIRVPKIRGMNVRLQLFTVPGQVYYAATRKLVLSGADGIVFVADSQSGRIEPNQESLDDLHANLAEHNRTLDEVPHTFHWNKRDLSDLVPIEELERKFNRLGAPSLGTIATKGDGVFEGLERITRLVMRTYQPSGKGAEEIAPETQRLTDAGIAEAIRALAEAAPAPRPFMAQGPVEDREAIVTVPPPPVESPVPATALGDEVKARPPSSPAPASPAPARPSHPAFSPLPPGASTGPSAPAAGPVSPPPERRESAARGGFSLAEIWPEADREGVRQAEAMIAAGDAVNAVLACDVLLTRVLASAAGLVGTLDAPRDPALVSLLLGLDGPRYVAFRTLVRAARHREPVTMRDALESFAFALEARRAREMLRAR